MQIPPPPMLQPYDPTRGQISCFTENAHAGGNISETTAASLQDLLVDHYEEAFRRLPIDDVPALSEILAMPCACDTRRKR
jgi:hypothetical protein